MGAPEWDEISVILQVAASAALKRLKDNEWMCDVVDKPIKSDILRDAIRAALASTTGVGQSAASAVA